MVFGRPAGQRRCRLRRECSERPILWGSPPRHPVDGAETVVTAYADRCPGWQRVDSWRMEGSRHVRYLTGAFIRP
ncbi:hypothetical protein Psuf_066620 [Phytohabitans suffuscus]|uniref:Uncharacterized protein n=1 Tax=Phytohabitans suffuscus TaxID=624315 RepID=A0A6F8YTF7_9ACTN|nr:hypothetical protein Psuf_066620 [Phytohabitans suffuscus]